MSVVDRSAAASDTITLAVTGDLSLSQFAAVVTNFRSLVEALTSEVGGRAQVNWTIEHLDAGSATTTIAGESPTPEVVERIVRAYAAVGRNLAEDQPVPYSERVRRPAEKIVAMLNGTITSVRFETQEEEATVVSASARDAVVTRQFNAYGAIEGRVQTLTSRGGLSFILWDSLYGRPVRCYLQPGREEIMRGAWERRAAVEGWVSRDPLTGRPVSVRHVEDVRLLDDVPRGSYRLARGAVPAQEGDAAPEDTIRVLRDAT